MAEQEDEKARVARLENQIKNLKLAIERERMDKENYRVGIGIRDEAIDGLNFVIAELNKEIAKTKTRTAVMH